MKIIKIVLKLKTPFITPLQSDTIFGHFAWGVVYKYGEGKLKELLKNFQSKPFIVFSDGFDKGKLPKPFLSSYLIPPNFMDLNKKYKKTNFIPKNWIFKNIDNLTDKVIFKKFKEEQFKYEKDKKTTLTLKNSIDRRFNRTSKGLYAINEIFYIENFAIEIYAKFDEGQISLEEIKEVFEFIGMRGYGKDKSSGKGKFGIEIFEDFEEKKFFKPKENRNFYLNLSTMFKDKKLQLSFGKKITKFPKSGGYLASHHPFKNPVIMFLPGTSFLIKEFNEVYGTAKEEVFNKKGYFHSGYSIGIYFGVKDAS
ncbi:type III-A CRISPR-associated RAMP protein Csm4 [Nitratiruptor tergarcus]|uniref:CRISPR system Cms protein Csm4 n=1 Tax=Nitratiruptor tergarcus DSM 16512 TaxID=1069081 RepID=A0A1W1WSH7_9BACT|nr:hypothetical protein [Nitratiruptor tergarcus]SMC09196.1 CRISPR-associated protein Csm4 [Nitratiruptor tergarcus DSM 16512]